MTAAEIKIIIGSLTAFLVAVFGFTKWVMGGMTKSLENRLGRVEEEMTHIRLGVSSNAIVNEQIGKSVDAIWGAVDAMRSTNEHLAVLIERQGATAQENRQAVRDTLGRIEGKVSA